MQNSLHSKKDYNEIICFMVDMSLPSGQDRLFVYDLNKDTVRNAGSCNAWPL